MTLNEDEQLKRDMNYILLKATALERRLEDLSLLAFLYRH